VAGKWQTGPDAELWWPTESTGIPEHVNGRGPSLDRHYPASSLLCPPPNTGTAGWRLLVPAVRWPFGTQQTACVVFDIDRDGAADIVIAERTRAPAIIWLRHTNRGWQKYVIDNRKLRPEAGGCPYDANGDGRLDIITKPYTWDTPRIDLWLNQGVSR